MKSCNYCEKENDGGIRGKHTLCSECRSYRWNNWHFWVIRKGMNEEEARAEVSKRQCRDRAFFVERYGEEIGAERCFRSKQSAGLVKSRKVKEDPQRYKKTFIRNIEYWLSKGFTPEEAENKRKEYCKIHNEKLCEVWDEGKYENRRSYAGEGNPMFGRPSPQGSGNGWSGWYRGFFFRSILELSFMKSLFDRNVRFESGELKKHRITYETEGRKRNYFPDFFLPDTGEYIEVKPSKLIGIKSNLSKFEAARSLFGEKFKVVTESEVERLGVRDLSKMITDGDLKWMQRYQTKWEKWILNEIS